MALRDVLLSFGIDIQGRDQLTQVNGEVRQIIHNVNIMASAFAGLAIGKGIVNFIKDTVEAGAKVVNTANQLGIATDELQKFEYAANLAGTGTDAADRSLQYFNRHLGLAAENNKAATKDFAALGINVKGANGELRPTSDVLIDVADAFKKLKNAPEQTAYSVKLFGRAGRGMVPILRQGGEAVKKVYQEFDRLGLGLRQDFLDSAKKAEQGLTRLHWGFEALKSRIVLAVLPAFNAAVDTFLEFSHSMSELVDHSYVAQTALIALGVIGAVALAPLLLEILPIVAGIGLLYLVFDDIYTLFKGGHSVIGEVIDDLFGVGSASNFVERVVTSVHEMKDAFFDVKNAIGGVIDAFAELWHDSTMLHDLEMVVKSLADTMMKLFKTIYSLPDIIAESVMGSSKTFDGIWAGFGDVLNDPYLGQIGQHEKGWKSWKQQKRDEFTDYNNHIPYAPGVAPEFNMQADQEHWAGKNQTGDIQNTTIFHVYGNMTEDVADEAVSKMNHRAAHQGVRSTGTRKGPAKASP